MRRISLVIAFVILAALLTLSGQVVTLYTDWL